jgi:CubicO group peptidase (beta-lactamase class C family)
MNAKRFPSVSAIRVPVLPFAVVCITAFLLFPGCGDKGTGPATEGDFWGEIDTFVTERMNPDGAGFGIAVVQDGKVVFIKGWGKANIAESLPFSPDSPTNLASLTKQFTAAAILILYEQDSLDLSAKIGDYFSEFPPAWSEITVHHLLTHQSGIPNYTTLVEAGAASYDGLTNQNALDLILQSGNLEFTPGEQSNYSNTGYVILAMLVEKISRMTYPDFLREKIFEPLGMQSTFVRREAIALPQNAAFSYDENNVFYDYDCYVYGDGGIYSTLNDVVKWDRALYTDQIIRQSTLELAYSGYTGGENNYGYGWMIGSHGGYPSYRHGGFFLGFLNYIYRVPGKNFMYLVLSNGGVFSNDGFGTWTDDLKDRIFDHCL